jgi:cell division protein FtsB
MSPNETTVTQVTRFRAALAIAVGFVAVLLVTAGAKGYRDLESVRDREALLQGRIASSESEIERLERRLELLRSAPDTLERMARETLGMVRPGEKVIVLGDLELSRVPGAVLGGSAEVVEIDVDELSEAVD